jgi:hypothetical protein
VHSRVGAASDALTPLLDLLAQKYGTRYVVFLQLEVHYLGRIALDVGGHGSWNLGVIGL